MANAFYPALAVDTRGPNLGNTLLLAEQIKGARQTRKANALSMKQRQQFNNMLVGGSAFDPSGNPIDLSRPKLQNPDGSFSTERSITVTEPGLNGGQPTNIPTIWDGRQLSEDEAIQRAIASNQKFPSFNSIDEAVNAAKARSERIGQIRGPQNVRGNFETNYGNLVALDPQRAKQIQDAFVSADNAQRAKMKFNNMAIGTAAAWADTPEKWEKAKAMLIQKGNLDPQTAAQYPFETRGMVIAQARDIENIVKAAEPLTDLGKTTVDEDRGFITPEDAAARRKKLTTSTPVAQVKIQNTQEGAFKKKYGEETGKYYADLFTQTQEAERKARTEIGRLDRLDRLLEQTYTGSGAEWTLAAKKAAQFLGFEMGDDIGQAEAGQALASEMALELRNPSGGAGMPGAMSDKDREFLQSMVPGLAQTSSGRKLMVETRKKLRQRDIEVARMARAYERKNGVLDSGFEDELAKFSAENPLFDDMATSEAEAPEILSKIPSMSATDLSSVDLTNPDVRDAVDKRLKELGF
jgi:hypothetical protein